MVDERLLLNHDTGILGPWRRRIQSGVAEMGVQEGLGLRGSQGNSEREGQGKTRRLEEALGEGGSSRTPTK